MIQITKRIYKISEDKYYEVDDKADFGKNENDRIVGLGFAKKIVKTRAKSKK